MTLARIVPERLEGRHVLWALLAFFGLMLVANGIFLYYALGTFNGFETTNPYKKGLAYNERIASAQAQAARGWASEAQYSAGTLTLNVRDRRGQGVSGLVLTGEVRRPVTDASDMAVTFREVAPGRYELPAGLAPGQWIVIAGSERPAFHVKHRFWVKEAR